MIGFGQGTQIGKSCSRALEAPRHEINTFVKRIDKEMTGFGQRTQIGKSSSRPLKRIDEEMIDLGTRNSDWEI